MKVCIQRKKIYPYARSKHCLSGFYIAYYLKSERHWHVYNCEQDHSFVQAATALTTYIFSPEECSNLSSNFSEVA